MSLLSSAVYANPETPCWLPATGATHEGPFIVNGDIDAVGGSMTATGGNVVAQKSVTTPAVGLQLADISGTTLFGITNTGGNNVIQSTAALYIAQDGQQLGNIRISTSAFGSFGDSFDIAGSINAVNGDIFARAAGSPPTQPGVGVYDATNNPLLMLTSGVGTTIMEIGAPLLFAEPNAVVANSGLQITPSGANADILTIGGRVITRELELLGSGDPAATVGTATLVAGQAVVNTTASDVTSHIFLTHTNLNASTAVGTLRITNRSANSFTVNSMTAAAGIEANDLSDFDWVIFNSA